MKILKGLVQLTWLLLAMYAIDYCIELILTKETLDGCIGVVLIIAILYATFVTNLGGYFFEKN